MKIVSKNSLNKDKTIKEKPIASELNGVRTINEKIKKLLLNCVNLKYQWDITLNNSNSYLTKPFVFSNIDFVDFVDEYLKEISNLINILIKDIELFDYEDLKNNHDFVLTLKECLSNCFVLHEEYDHLSNNAEDFSDCGYPIEYSHNKSEINNLMNTIIETVVNSSWVNCFDSLIVNGFDNYNFNSNIPSMKDIIC